MARTRAAKVKNSDSENTIEKYDKLQTSYQLACYKFWCNLEFGGGELWDPNKVPNSIINWRSSSYLRKNIKQGSWANIGRVSSVVFVIICYCLRRSTTWLTTVAGGSILSFSSWGERLDGNIRDGNRHHWQLLRIFIYCSNLLTGCHFVIPFLSSAHVTASKGIEQTRTHPSESY